MKGIGASPGIAIGRTLVKKDPEVVIERKSIQNADDEIKRLTGAVNTGKDQIEALYRNVLQNIGEKEAQIFQAHRMILDDPEFLGQAEQKIKTEKMNAEWALAEVTEMYVRIFKNMDNEYMRERAGDIQDISDRLMRILMGAEETTLSGIVGEVIIVAGDLTPSDTAGMDRNKVKGLIIENGGKTSHSAIIARTLEIPAVVGVENAAAVFENGDTVIIDGDEGIVIKSPEEGMIREYSIKKENYDSFKRELKGLRGQKTITKDGSRVELAANIGTPDDMDAVIENDGEGIGLFRTEFLYMDRDRLPTEDEQFEDYKEVALKMEGKSVVIRTLDIGGDKALPCLEIPREMNPFLGYRAIRLCLDRPEIFRTQLRAILRASVFGNIKMMFPMISGITELRQARSILEQVKEDLRRESIKFKEDLEVGIMVEVPAAAIISDLLAKEVDFFSIGTNDLIQYLTAVDRGNRKISHLYSQFHPALLRMIKQVIDNGHAAGVWVGMCGEAAGDPKLIPLLVGMGLDEFSMNPASMLKARWIIKNTVREDMKSKVEKAVNLSTAEEIEKFIDENVTIK